VSLKVTKISTAISAMMIAIFAMPNLALSEGLRMDISDPAEPVPTSCLATGKACSAERSTVNGLMVNPASLAPLGLAKGALHMNFGSIIENTTETRNAVRTDSSQYSLGAGQQFGSIGVGFLISGRQAGSAAELNPKLDQNSEQTQIGSTSVKAAVTLTQQLSFGMSYGQNYVTQTASANGGSESTRKVDQRFRGATATYGVIYGDPIYSTISFMHRPSSQLNPDLNAQDSWTNTISNTPKNTDNTHDQFVIPAKTTIGYETVLSGGFLRTLVFRSDISIIEPTKDTFAFNASYMSYRQDRSSLEKTNAAYQFSPSAGLTLNLFKSFIFNDFSIGAYTDDARSSKLDGNRHYTYGVAKQYQILDWEFSCNISVDQSENTRRYLINFF